jgi:hypothetical protein
MIALRDNFPLVRFQDGSVMNYDRTWLTAAVIRAAETAGYKKWWLTNHVTESISSFLQQDFDENIVTISRLEKAVQSVLQVIGYSDVARCFQTLPPPVRISLADLARRAGNGYELVFFELLRASLHEIPDSNVQQVEFHDLHPCVKLLRGAKAWRADCEQLTGEIVLFIRTELDRSAPRRELHLRLT